MTDILLKYGLPAAATATTAYFAYKTVQSDNNSKRETKELDILHEYVKGSEERKNTWTKVGAGITGMAAAVAIRLGTSYMNQSRDDPLNDSLGLLE